MPALLLGLDLGTTATKGALLDPQRGLAATAGRPVALHSPSSGQAQAEAHEWWANTCALIPELLAQASATAADVAAVATTGMVPAVLCVGDEGALRPAVLQNDARAAAEIDEIAAIVGALDLVALTGSPLSQQSVAPTTRWLARHEPQTWKATRWICGSYDWLATALGAEPHVERNWAIESGLFDLDGTPLDAVVEAGSMRPDQLPAIARGGDAVGVVSPTAAAATGLAAGTPIVAGGADHVLSAFAAGLCRPGDMLIKLGGAGDILAVSAEPIVDARLYLDAHPDPALWLPNGCMATSGSLVRWCQRLVGEDDLGVLDAEAAGAAPAAALCLPYFLGEKSPLHDPRLRGAFAGLQLHHDRGTLYRAVLEAVAYGFRHHVDIFAELGLEPAKVWVTNGGSRSPLWKQVVADVLGRALIPVVDHPGASLGAAIVAGIGIGALDGWQSVHGYVIEDVPVEPDPAHRAVYDEAYAIWQQLGDALRPISHQLASRRDHD